MAEKEACPKCGKVTYSFLHSCPGVPQNPVTAPERTESPTEGTAGLLAAHPRGDWSDHTYNCSGCAQRFEQEAQARFDALGRKPTREELVEFRNELGRVSYPGWTLAEYHAHLAAVLDAHVTERCAETLEEAARDLPGFDGIRTHGDAAHWLRDRAAAMRGEG